MNGNIGIFTAGKLGVLAIFCFWLLPVTGYSQSTSPARATKGGIVIGGNVTLSDIRVMVNNGFSPQDVKIIIQNAVKPFSDTSASQKKEIDQLSSVLGEKSSIFRAFSKAIGGEYKSDSDFIVLFFDFVNRYNELERQNKEFQSGDELDRAVQTALNEGDLEKAQTLQLAKKYVFNQRSQINHKYSLNSIIFTDGWDINIVKVKIPKISNTSIEQSDILLFKEAHVKFQSALTEINGKNLINDI